MKIDLSGKTALVTGSTSGIGHAIAKGLLAAGADVVINGRAQAKVDAVAAALGKTAGKAGGKVRAVAADVSTAAGCKALVAALPDVDILITTPAFSSQNPSSIFPTRTGAACSIST